MWTTKAVKICWWFLREACSRHGWWRTQEVSRGTGERLGAVGETTQCMGSLLISLLVQWILEWGTKERKCFRFVFFFLPCYKASVPPWRPGSWLVASPLLLLPVSSPGHTLPRQNLSLNQDLYARLFSFWAFLPRATQHWFSLLVQSSQLCSFSLCDTGD